MATQTVDMSTSVGSISLDQVNYTHFKFNVTERCRVCFSVNTAFGTLSGGTFDREVGTWAPDPAGNGWAMPGANQSMEFNAVTYGGTCSLPPGGRIIHTGS